MLPLNQLGSNPFRDQKQYAHLFPPNFPSTNKNTKPIFLNNFNESFNSEQEHTYPKHYPSSNLFTHNIDSSNENKALCDYNNFSNLKYIDRPIKSILRKADNQVGPNRHVLFGPTIVKSYSNLDTEGEPNTPDYMNTLRDNQNNKPYYPLSYNIALSQKDDCINTPNNENYANTQNDARFYGHTQCGLPNTQFSSNFSQTQQSAPIHILKHNSYYPYNSLPERKSSDTNIATSTNNNSEDFLKYCRDMQNNQFSSLSTTSPTQNPRIKCPYFNQNLKIDSNNNSNQTYNNLNYSEHKNCSSENTPELDCRQYHQSTYGSCQNRQLPNYPSNSVYQHKLNSNRQYNECDRLITSNSYNPTMLRPTSPSQFQRSDVNQHFAYQNFPLHHSNEQMSFNGEGAITNFSNCVPALNTAPLMNQLVSPTFGEVNSPVAQMAAQSTSALSAFRNTFKEDLNTDPCNNFHVEIGPPQVQREHFVLANSGLQNPITISHILNLPPQLTFLRNQSDMAYFYLDRFELYSDVRVFTPEKIRVNVFPSYIELQAVIECVQNGSVIAAGICRSYELPYKVIPEQGYCYLHHDGILIISVPWCK